jgi:hypothetical protein
LGEGEKEGEGRGKKREEQDRKESEGKGKGKERGEEWGEKNGEWTSIFSIDYAMVGLSRGGQQVGKCKEVFGKAVQLLVELASLQVSMFAQKETLSSVLDFVDILHHPG